MMGVENSMKTKGQRKDERCTYERPEFISVDFKLAPASQKEKVYSLNVVDGSRCGLGILVTQKDFDLLRKLKPGQKIENMRFFAPWAMIKVDVIVRHISKITEGKYKGCFLLGIESQDIKGNYKPD